MIDEVVFRQLKQILFPVYSNNCGFALHRFYETHETLIDNKRFSGVRKIKPQNVNMLRFAVKIPRIVKDNNLKGFVYN